MMVKKALAVGGGALFLVFLVSVSLLSRKKAFTFSFTRTGGSRESVFEEVSSTGSAAPQNLSEEENPPSVYDEASEVAPEEAESRSGSSVSSERRDLLAEFIYPQATLLRRTPDELLLQSGESPKVITSWYEILIRELGFQVTSFVRVDTNGEVKNELVGATKEEEVRVALSKPSGSEKVTISVVVD